VAQAEHEGTRQDGSLREHDLVVVANRLPVDA